MNNQQQALIDTINQNCDAVMLQAYNLSFLQSHLNHHPERVNAANVDTALRICARIEEVVQTIRQAAQDVPL